MRVEHLLALVASLSLMTGGCFGESLDENPPPGPGHQVYSAADLQSFNISDGPLVERSDWPQQASGLLLEIVPMRDVAYQEWALSVEHDVAWPSVLSSPDQTTSGARCSAVWQADHLGTAALLRPAPAPAAFRAGTIEGATPRVLNSGHGGGTLLLLGAQQAYEGRFLAVAVDDIAQWGSFSASILTGESSERFYWRIVDTVTLHCGTAPDDFSGGHFARTGPVATWTNVRQELPTMRFSQTWLTWGGGLDCEVRLVAEASIIWSTECSSSTPTSDGIVLETGALPGLAIESPSMIGAGFGGPYLDYVFVGSDRPIGPMVYTTTVLPA